MEHLLDRIHGPEDVRALDAEQTEKLCEEIRSFLVEHVSGTGGHLGPNLGVVELTVALHQSFNTPKDKIVWDVGHQTYVHKILTGRKDRFDTLRQKDGLSGFPKVAESEYDTFDMGHASTSISVAYGLVKARDIKHEDHQVVCVIGDGSLTGGMAYEAMNNAGHDKTGMIVVLNDNKMSINRSVGSMAAHLGRLRTRSAYLRSKRQVKEAVKEHPALRPVYDASHYLKDRIKYMMTDGVMFEEMGFTYLGPVDGHDVAALKVVFEQARMLKEPVLVHVITQKGKGYAPAENEPERFHGVAPFDPETGVEKKSANAESFAEVFGKKLNELGEKDTSIALVTAAMSDGTGVTECKDMNGRVFDVGIAEEHAVTFAAGLARGGMHPFVAIYSTFMQRAYDQILHDVCLQDLPVVLALDHSGIVGEDGETHQGIFDIAFGSHMPNMTIFAPSCKEELEWVMDEARTFSHPLMIRYPKGQAISMSLPDKQQLRWGKSRIVMAAAEEKTGALLTFLSVGTCLPAALESARLWQERHPECRVQVIDARFVMPLDREMLETVCRESTLVVTIEDGVAVGGFGELCSAFCKQQKWQAEMMSIALPNCFIPQDRREHALAEYGICPDAIADKLEQYPW